MTPVTRAFCSTRPLTSRRHFKPLPVCWSPAPEEPHYSARSSIERIHFSQIHRLPTDSHVDTRKTRINQTNVRVQHLPCALPKLFNHKISAHNQWAPSSSGIKRSVQRALGKDEINFRCSSNSTSQVVNQNSFFLSPLSRVGSMLLSCCFFTHRVELERPRRESSENNKRSLSASHISHENENSLMNSPAGSAFASESAAIVARRLELPAISE